jgi:hypothetical protein
VQSAPLKAALIGRALSVLLKSRLLLLPPAKSPDANAQTMSQASTESRETHYSIRAINDKM